jgi:hypothetical protein
MKRDWKLEVLAWLIRRMQSREPFCWLCQSHKMADLTKRFPGDLWHCADYGACMERYHHKHPAKP